MNPEPSQCLLHYRLGERLGHGGMGEVWRATDTHLGREIALKFLPADRTGDPERRADLAREARTLAALDHPNIVTVFSLEQAEGTHFLTMELVRGQPLSEAIPPGGLPLLRLLPIAIQLCDAIAAAHRNGVIHRDLKPSNVMLAESDRVKVLDFGLARLREPGALAPAPDETAALPMSARRITGTLAYTPPEQFHGQPLDQRSDLFSLGVLLYEMATGRRPFRGETPAEIVSAILRDNPLPLGTLKPDFPRTLDSLVRRCLEKDPALRPPSAGAVSEELREQLRAARAPAPEGPRSIAVLPLQDLSPQKDQDYFCDGMAEEILTALSRVRGLQVASRTSSFRFKGASLDAREMGDRLGVSTLLDGSVRKSGTQLRITVRLTDVASGYQLWSESYDRDLRDVFAIQDEIAHSVVGALRVTLSPRERRAIKRVATSDERAYDYYLRGRKYFLQYRRRGVEFALQMFSRAIDLDPAYAQAWAGVADCCTFLYVHATRSHQLRERAEEASRRALELDPEAAEAHVSRGVALSLLSRHDEAEREFQAALRLNPELFEANYFYARDCFTQGNKEKAIRLYERASALRPEDYQSPLLVAQIYDDLGQPGRAREERLRGVAAAEQRIDHEPDDVRALYMGANGLVALGERAKGLRWAQRALELEPDESMVLYNLACIYALAGEGDQAVTCLERAVDHGFAARDWLASDSNLDPVRGHPRFARLLERMVT